MRIELPIETILARPPDSSGLEVIGRSREGREIRGRVFGHGAERVSLIGGCHADEPVGPETLERLAGFLAGLADHHPLLARATWFVVPHVNPDGRARNAAWSAAPRPARAHDGGPDRGFDLGLYLRHVIRELPGDDVEFGFPRDPGDRTARPENRAVAAFLAPGAPFAVHGTLHGMGFAPGPWFLLEAAWAERARELRDRLRSRVRAMGYGLLDIDRGGEKGFHRIDEGFSTRPDSGAMREHFLALGDAETAGRFRPSSMEHIRALGGDPLTFVSENPLFVVPAEVDSSVLRAELAELACEDPRAASERGAELGVTAMPIGDQQRLQLAFVNEALAAVEPSG